jgi:AcrR family transcriptional regulator
MNDVAEAAGVTKPVLYQHFRSKRDLFSAVLADVGSRLLDDITKAAASATTPREQVEVGFRAYFRFVADDPASFQVLFGGDTRRDDEFARQVSDVEDAIVEAVTTLIEVEGLEGSERRLLAHGLVGLAEGISRAWTSGSDSEPPEQLAALVADLAWRGLRGIRA